MFDFYIAGGLSNNIIDFAIKYNANILQSYANDMSSINKLCELKQNGIWKGKLLVDSGAFSVHKSGRIINIDDYIQFINSHPYVDYFIQLDVIPGKWGHIKTASDREYAADNTFINYKYMLKYVNDPYKILPVFHQGESFTYLKQFLSETIDGKPVPYICISGNKELTSNQRKIWYSKVFDIIKNSPNPNISTHCLGSATISDMQDYPFRSSDATTWVIHSSVYNIITKYGIIYVGKDSKFNSMLNENNLVISYIKDMCKKYNIDVDTLSTDYKQRNLFNCAYLYECSLNTKYKGVNSKKRRLF